MKREADGDMGSPHKRTRRGDEEVRLLIPSKVAGSIIGKGGQNITKLRSQYKASITVPDCPGPERMLTLSSDLETICNIVADVIPNLEENGSRTNSNELDLRMMIHQSQAGCVIGKAGCKIKEIRDKTGARIKIFSNLAPQSTDRIIQIVGEAPKCIDTIREVINLIKGTPIKGIVNPYDPHNYDDFYSEEYGGWGGNAGGGGGGGGGDRRSGGGRGGGGGGREGGGNFRGGSGGSGPRGGRGGGGNMRDSPRFNRGDPPMRSGGLLGNFNDRGSRGGRGGGGGGGDSFMGRGSFGGGRNSNGGGSGGFGGGSGGGFGGGSGGFGGGSGGFGGGSGGFGGERVWDNAPNDDFISRPSGGMGGGGGGLNQSSPMQSLGNQNGVGGGRNTTQVTIPKDLAGAIIGKGGGRIRKIRQDSGAGITIDEPLPGSSDRIITIAGSPNQIQMAQYLLQQSVHNNTERGGNNY